MTTILKRLFYPNQAPTDKAMGKSGQLKLEDENIPDGPYILASAFYLAVFVLVGLPMWFYTCSVIRYPLPSLTSLEQRLLNGEQLKLHLDISIVQLVRNDNLTDHLRTNLPNQLSTTIENVTYDIGWRVRRPTQPEDELFKLHQNNFKQFSSDSLVNLENKLINIHKPTNRFRLFVYMIDDAYHKTYCDPSKATGYTISFERFVYLCSPAKDFQSTIVTIREILEEVYVDTVDLKNSKNILGSKLDLLFSILPESSDSHHLTLALADKIHKIYDKNVKSKFPELNELVNIRLITNNVVDFLRSKQIINLLNPKPSDTNDNNNDTTRTLQAEKMGHIFNTFQSRMSKPSSQFVQNILSIQPDPRKAPIVFKRGLSSILEGDDLNFMILANHEDDKGLVLAMRSLIRRIVGLKSVNLCKSCLVRRDVFMNRWEIDAIMSALVTKKLHRTYKSLNSIQNQVIGIKIPKEVADLAAESNALALSSLDHLETKQLLESYRLASRAYESSEAAFFDPSLLESLYFPEDLKYGVYMPLFLPMAIALLWSVYNIASFLWNRRRKLKIN